MARTISLDDDAFRIRYRGPVVLMLLLREVAVPYGEISDVTVGLEKPPKFYLRIGAYVQGRMLRGRFKSTEKEWWFLDVRGDRERAVVIRTIPGSKYTVVAVQPADDEDPQAIADGIRARL